jgi:hypothetical protein
MPSAARPPSIGLDGAEVGDLAEQLGQVVGVGRACERADRQLDLARKRSPYRGRWCGRCRGRGIGARRRWGRGQRARARSECADVEQQRCGVDRFAAAALVARKLRAQRVAGLQQGVDHRAAGCEFAPAQLVEQRLHLVRQLGHVVEAERRRAALDRVRAAKDRVERLVVGGCDVEREQQRLHLLEVLACLLEEDLVELGQIDAGGGLRCVGAHVASGRSWLAAAFSG